MLARCAKYTERTESTLQYQECGYQRKLLDDVTHNFATTLKGVETFELKGMNESYLVLIEEEIPFPDNMFVQLQQRWDLWLHLDLVDAPRALWEPCRLWQGTQCLWLHALDRPKCFHPCFSALCCYLQRICTRLSVVMLESDIISGRGMMIHFSEVEGWRSESISVGSHLREAVIGYGLFWSTTASPHLLPGWREQLTSSVAAVHNLSSDAKPLLFSA